MLKRRFVAALVLTGITQAQWAKEQGVTYQAVHHLLAGRMNSKRLMTEIVRFTDRVFREHLPLSTSTKEAA